MDRGGKSDGNFSPVRVLINFAGKIWTEVGNSVFPEAFRSFQARKWPDRTCRIQKPKIQKKLSLSPLIVCLPGFANLYLRRHYDPTNPSQWNPYSIAMQAAEQNRNRNADFTSTNSTSNPSWRPPDGAGAGEAAEGGSNEAEEDRGKKGIGAWFRGLTGGVGAAENGGVGGVTGTASAGRGGGWWGNGEARGGGGGNGEVGKLSSPAAAQVKALVEMGFEEVSSMALVAYIRLLLPLYCRNNYCFEGE